MTSIAKTSYERDLERTIVRESVAATFKGFTRLDATLRAHLNLEGDSRAVQELKALASNAGQEDASRSSPTTTRALLDDGFGRLDSSINRALEKLGRQLKATTGETETSTQFLKLKQEAFEFAERGNFARSLTIAREALCVRRPGASVDDSVERDPMLNVLVSRILLAGLDDPGSVADDEVIAVAAENAWAKGADSNDPDERQSAAEAARVLSVLKRRQGQVEDGIRLARVGFELEQFDTLRASTFLLAALVTGEESVEDIGAAVALASLTKSGIAAHFLQEAALAHSPQRTDAVLAQTRTLLASLVERVGNATAARTGEWNSMLAKLDASLPSDTVAPSNDALAAMSLESLAGLARATTRQARQTQEECIGHLKRLVGGRIESVTRQLEKTRRLHERTNEGVGEQGQRSVRQRNQYTAMTFMILMWSFIVPFVAALAALNLIDGVGTAIKITAAAAIALVVAGSVANARLKKSRARNLAAAEKLDSLANLNRTVARYSSSLGTLVEKTRSGFKEVVASGEKRVEQMAPFPELDDSEEPRFDVLPLLSGARFALDEMASRLSPTHDRATLDGLDALVQDCLGLETGRRKVASAESLANEFLT